MSTKLVSEWMLIDSLFNICQYVIKLNSYSYRLSVVFRVKLDEK